jgi:heme/copper-type cytochrome/quinol oxidase subunit 4
VESALPATGRPPRAARSGAVALVAVTTSVGGHALAGGPVPPLPALAAFTVAVAALTTGLARLRWTPMRLVAALAVAQGGFHLAFEHLGRQPESAVDLRMVAWHLVATAVACALVLRAEAWWWRVFARRDHPSPAPASAPPPLRPAGGVDPPSRPALDRAIPRRGPPLSAAR